MEVEFALFAQEAQIVDGKITASCVGIRRVWPRRTADATHLTLIAGLSLSSDEADQPPWIDLNVTLPDGVAGEMYLTSRGGQFHIDRDHPHEATMLVVLQREWPAFYLPGTYMFHVTANGQAIADVPLIVRERP